MKIIEKFLINMKEHKEVINLISDSKLNICEAAEEMISCVKRGNKIITAGNGGSMADAQHFTAELVNSFFNKKRKAISAVALGTNPAVVSAWSNDINYDEQFSRELEAIGKEGDILFLISTSGNSANLLSAAKLAKEKGIKIIGLLGRDGGKLKEFTDLNIVVLSNSTPRIQEAHLLIYHTLAEIIEDEVSEN